MERIVYRFDGFSVDPTEQRLQKDGVDVALPPKAFDVLVVLLRNQGRLVNYAELMDEVWRDAFVEETNLRLAIHTLRKTITGAYIETIPKRGYRFNASVTVTVENTFNRIAEQSQAASESGKKRFLTAASLVTALVLVSLLAYGLWWVFGPDETVPIGAQRTKTIAVLPFAVVGNTTRQISGIQNGLLDSMSFNLSRIRHLRVLTHSAGEGDGSITPSELGKKLGVNEILTGTYRRDEKESSLQFRLIDPETGEPVIAETITAADEIEEDREASLNLQLARQIDLWMQRHLDVALVKDAPIDSESRSKFLAAKQIPREQVFSRWHESAELLKRVVIANPSWAPGYAAYAEALILTRSNAENCTEASQIANRAIELDPRSGVPHLVIGICHRANMKWVEAEESFKRAVVLSPELDRAYLEYGIILDYQRRFAEAEINLKRAVELQPFAPFYELVLCEHYYFDKQYEKAVSHCRRSRFIEPGYWLANKKLYWIFLQKKDYSELFRLLKLPLPLDDSPDNAELGPIDREDFVAYWETATRNRTKPEHPQYHPVAAAAFFAHSNKTANALSELEKAALKPDDSLLRAHANPAFDSIRNEPRFIKIFKSVGLQR